MSQQVVYELSIKDLFTGKLNNANAAVNKFESSMNRAQSSAMSLGAALGVTFGIAGVVAFGRSVLQAGMTVEDATTGLTTALKDANEAQRVINNTMEDAQKTPFNFEVLLKANQSLISTGLEADQAREDVINLANAIAGAGRGNYELERMVLNMQEVANNGTLMGKDVKQFGTAGINIYRLLADATGQPISKIHEMKISYETLSQALKKAGQEGGLYYNALQNMQKNTSVQVSNLGDAMFKLSVQIFTDLKPAINSITLSLQEMIVKLADGWSWIMQNAEAFKALAVGAAVSFGLYKGYLITTMAIQATQTVITYGQIAAMYVLGAAYDTATIASKILAAATYVLNAAFAGSGIGLLVIGIGAFVSAMVYAYNASAKFRGMLFGLWGIVKGFGLVIMDVFSGIQKMYQGIFSFDPYKYAEGVGETIAAVRNAGEKIGKAAKEGYQAGLADFAIDNPTTNAPKKIKPPKPKENDLALKPETKGAQGQKAVTINIKINDLVKELNINTVNMKEGVGKLREIIAETLMGATNDAQLISGQ
jgi:hypothetical protein